MFYSTEILSHKNKTELSILYYISTTDKLKKISKKEILELDFNNLLNQLLQPKIPFALRLYSYLLKGLVKVWILKMEFYKKQVNSFLKLAKLKKRKYKKTDILEDFNANLQIKDEIISQLEESCISSTIDYRPDININQDWNADFDDYLSQDTPIIDDIKIKRRKIEDKYDITTIISVLSKELRNPAKFEIPNLLNTFIISKFNNALRFQNENNHINEYLFDDWNLRQEFSSLEDPRISSSISQDRELNRIPKKTEASKSVDLDLMSKAEWFYSILVEASKGEIIPIQKSQWGDIEVQVVNKN